MISFNYTHIKMRNIYVSCIFKSCN